MFDFINRFKTSIKRFFCDHNWKHVRTKIDFPSYYKCEKCEKTKDNHEKSMCLCEFIFVMFTTLAFFGIVLVVIKAVLSMEVI